MSTLPIIPGFVTRRVVLLGFGALFYSASLGSEAYGMDRCVRPPKEVVVSKKSTQCGQVPTVKLTGSFKNSFSAAFRWDDGSSSGQDRSPFDLNNGSNSSSPYKTQRRIRTKSADYLCFGRFINRKNFPRAEQLTIKRTAAPVVSRYCVNLGR